MPPNQVRVLCFVICGPLPRLEEMMCFIWFPRFLCSVFVVIATVTAGLQDNVVPLALVGDSAVF